MDLKRERDFEKLFEDHYRAVKSFFFRQGCSEDDSQDLTQEVFISAYGALDGFRGESNTRTWLTRIARNRLLNFLRERRAGKRYEPQPAVSSSDELAGELPDPKSKSPEEELLAAESMAQLQASIAGLPFKMRRCMQLRAEKELQYKEIAKTMGVSIETIKSHLHQARVRLENHGGARLDRGAK